MSRVEYPHVPAAFINTIAEEGSKDLAIGFLQEEWNKSCFLEKENKELKQTIKQINQWIYNWYPDGTFIDDPDWEPVQQRIDKVLMEIESELCDVKT